MLWRMKISMDDQNESLARPRAYRGGERNALFFAGDWKVRSRLPCIYSHLGNYLEC
jgi:hypothetical protein